MWEVIFTLKICFLQRNSKTVVCYNGGTDFQIEVKSNHFYCHITRMAELASESEIDHYLQYSTINAYCTKNICVTVLYIKTTQSNCATIYYSTYAQMQQYT